MTLIKICGITSLSDALFAIEAGADALGFNFYPPSPRYIEPQAARKIIDELPSTTITFGVFVNYDTPDEVRRISQEAGVSAVQLHGDESPEYCQMLSDMDVVKVVAIGSEFDPEMVRVYEVGAIMVDARHDKLRGGTGRVVDWSIARQVRELVPRLYLAGGLAPDNVAAAIAAVGPYAVDACSGLEDAPGRKSRDRMLAFVKAVRDVKP